MRSHPGFHYLYLQNRIRSFDTFVLTTIGDNVKYNPEMLTWPAESPFLQYNPNESHVSKNINLLLQVPSTTVIHPIHLQISIKSRRKLLINGRALTNTIIVFSSITEDQSQLTISCPFGCCRTFERYKESSISRSSMASSSFCSSLPTTAARISSKTQFVSGLKSKKLILGSRSLVKPRRLFSSVRRVMGSSASSPDRAQGIFFS